MFLLPFKKRIFIQIKIRKTDNHAIKFLKFLSPTLVALADIQEETISTMAHKKAVYSFQTTCLLTI
jgi:hypothetical protein